MSDGTKHLTTKRPGKPVVLHDHLFAMIVRQQTMPDMNDLSGKDTIPVRKSRRASVRACARPQTQML